MKISAAEAIRACTATIRYGDKVLRDEGHGHLLGEGVGRINYETGDMIFLPQGEPPEDVTVTFHGMDGRFRELHLIPIEKMRFHPCPVCGRKATVVEEDQWKCRKVLCKDHGEFTLQG